jgi:hypothetical protein
MGGPGTFLPFPSDRTEPELLGVGELPKPLQMLVGNVGGWVAGAGAKGSPGASTGAAGWHWQLVASGFLDARNSRDATK